MSEKEKKAIEYLRENSLVRIENGKIVAYGNSYKLILLNLIDKQQKEIEELIKLNTPMSWEMKDKDGNVVVSLKKPDNYISKDKIREAIKNREIELYADNPENNFIPFDKVIDTLKELLEEK